MRVLAFASGKQVQAVVSALAGQHALQQAVTVNEMVLERCGDALPPGLPWHSR